MGTALGWVAWGIVAILALAWAYGCRNCVASGQRLDHTNALLTLFWWVIALVFLVSDISKLHIFWIAPSAWLLAFLLSPLVGIPVLSPLFSLIAQVFVRLITTGASRPSSTS